MDERPLRLLAVDDDENVLAILRRGLPAHGFEVTTTCDPKGVVGLARAMQPDLVLLDVMMPGLDGFSATEALKSDPRTRHAPIVIFTALDTHVIDAALYALGVQEVASKTMPIDHLAARLRAIVGYLA